jgi:CD109 antigen
MAAAAGSARSDVDATVTLQAGAWRKELRVTPDNADTLQIVDLPLDSPVSVDVRGKGQLTAQTVRRYNLPAAERADDPVFRLDVQYSSAQVEVNDLITVTARVRFTPPAPIEAGMVVVDVSIPTGFAAETESLDSLAKRTPRLKRYDLAGRKVILYVEDMQPEEELTFTFQARALYPVRAQAVASQAYSYYRPEWAAESLGGEIAVGNA